MFTEKSICDDLGTEETLNFLEKFISTLKWQETFIDFMNSKYS